MIAESKDEGDIQDSKTNVTNDTRKSVSQNK